MRILIYCLNYSPELTGIGKYCGEMAEWLSEKNHDVRVCTAVPYYPDWKVFPNYRNGRYSVECDGRVKIFRSPIWVPRKPTGVKRILHLLSFSFFSIPSLLKQISWRPDVVWVVAPSFFTAPLALLLSKYVRARSWLHIQDFEVDAAFKMGIVRGQWLKKVVLRGEGAVLGKFDRISTISSRMFELTTRKCGGAEKLMLFPNWVDISNIRVLNARSVFRDELNIDANKVVALYSGNIGQKQGIEILGEVARVLDKDSRIVFVFCGTGAGKVALMQQCVGLSNVRFLDLQPLARLSELLGMADIHLLPQRADAEDLVMPSKLTGMMASGRAVLATANSGTELDRVIREEAKCGLVVPPEDLELLTKAVLKLVEDGDLRDKLGLNGRAFAELRVSKENILQEFERNLLTLVHEQV